MLNIYTERKAGNGEEGKKKKKSAIELVEEEKEEKEKEGHFPAIRESWMSN